MTELERLVQMVREVGGLSTGHADTPEELMAEVLEQVKRLRKNLRSVRFRLAEYEPDITGYEYEEDPGSIY